MMNRILLLIALPFIFTITGCDRIDAEFQLMGKNSEISDLKAYNKTLIYENRDLTVQVARLNVGNTDGQLIEELRKALTKKESELKLFESRLNKREQSIISNETNLDKGKRQFLSDNTEGLKNIGEARQLKVEYEFMRDKFNKADNRAHNWLIYFSILMVMFMTAIFFAINKAMKYSARNAQIDTALKIINSTGIDSRDKELVMSTFERIDNKKDD